MPLDRFVLMLVIVVVAAGVTVFVASTVLGAMLSPGLGLAVMIPLGLIAFVVWRVISDRIGNREDDHYDHLEK
ncbi:hypothetical protein Dshi_1072 [Dinoroseobacter shibae DFL 12 = DSM 16493]|jgi:ABC-type transport system involved in cytochrome bd biosynthesis fused ATPase/permease subunit|uniref:Uncharacterized protein n=1 Tax=Dinoroseobacter shibae (strain DSM 16493 / NCIMB 14021 / DFL 12) TaxID=398580 RepID=A8LSK0_DINSH|nr:MULTISPECIES: hypothetical protein [Dinoroseobacter]ABV92814.1 hypothetical protein Dshi_1072 [Dinoroseobacter shibae DFL 12 = DSM 16493]MDD9715914.1 hypothetical protein [Dinoroseobacter sp. PD6]URF47755.1 hypothetical protein M8008_05570 [Dinoroseobacter shibae]URF52065.1 hypothetical protein M8007_05570 [Dinoroseobacter shibae]